MFSDEYKLYLQFYEMSKVDDFYLSNPLFDTFVAEKIENNPS